MTPAAVRAALAHPAGLSTAAAIELQHAARPLVVATGIRGTPRLVAGIDVSIASGAAHAAVALFDLERWRVVEIARAGAAVTFPYVPGLLAFREVPVVLAAWRRLRTRPDLLLVDGHGTIHPRRFGLACHLGVVLDLPAIGVGKTRLCGQARQPGPRRGAATRVLLGGEVVGRLLRTRDGVAPLWISIGHRITLDDAVRMTLRCGSRFRLPDPIRAAHAAAAGNDIDIASVRRKNAPPRSRPA
ncbi:MAG: endonuclease V [Planctomycetes bacterium]|nr:endonuclease V [Planctomycetota bacterium]